MTVARVLIDWLDTTHPVEHHSYDESTVDGFLSDVQIFFSSCGGEVKGTSKESYKSLWRFGDKGALVVDNTPKFLRLSASGAVLAHFRAIGVFNKYVSLLASVPHKITRGDVAGDRVDCSPPHVISSLRKKYPEKCSLGRKSLKTRSYLSSNCDGKQTGTFYIGDRRTSKQTGRIYDKTHEMIEKHGERIEPTLRYEFTSTSKHGMSLNDVINPEPLFWHFASEFLPRPKNVPLWAPVDVPEWSLDAFDPCMGQVLKQSVENSSQLKHWLDLASKDGSGGIKYLRSLLDAALTKAENSN